MAIIAYWVFSYFLKEKYIRLYPFAFLMYLSMFMYRYLPLIATLAERKPITYGFERPYIGSLLFAERTEVHLALFQEDIEAVFWNDPKECAEKCLKLLGDKVLINEITKKGQNRLLTDQRGNEDVVNYILGQFI
ncbi:glycosyltransferase family 1 protein [Maribacter arenosus]|uniref:Glycosyltransferase family 1 protein n=2 Tax=Maribacter arenosus TaxID=1854708 RepID=A0ABR7VAX9_9FLAO|nr:glycosyltransferase family 1 protein [Maribacter arenosus]